ncbi:MAG TPA: hypothetical protein VLJ15_01255 [Gammaproteobacteria bacterium]|nr:hypothetical protein [Gammaproteobacteria bacterium]
MYQKRNSIGMTLIELMLSLTISFLLISGVFQMYLTAENNQHLQSSLTLLQENAMMMTQVLKNRLRAVAFTGCAKLTDDFPFTNHLPFPLNPENRITAYESSQIKPGTDAIRIWSFNPAGDFLLKKMTGHSVLYVSSGVAFKTNDYLAISDCKTTETFRAANVFEAGENQQKIITDKPLEKLYDKQAEINQVEIDTYFVGKTERVDEKNQPIDALFSENIHGDTMEIAEGVSEMKITFSTQAGNQLMELPVHEIKQAENVKGISFDFDLTAVSRARLNKKWNIYVALP